MKHFFSLIFASIFICTFASAQTVGKRVKDRATSDANYGVDRTVDKTIDGAFDKTGKAVGNIFKKKDKKAKTIDAGTSASSSGDATNSGSASSGKGKSTPAGGMAFSDFVPGQTVIFSDDFSKDAIADFPAKWNSNGSGRVTTLSGLQGRWLALKTNTAITPEMTKALPENATIEFDLYLDASNGQTTPFVQFGLTQVKNILKEDLFYKDRFFMNIHNYAENDAHAVEYGLKNDVLGTKNDFPITSYANKILHISMALNKTRLRIYLDQTKVIDLPRVIETDMRTNFFINSNSVIPAPELDMYIANVRIASAETDARSMLIKQLMEDGKAVTNDILFDVNSDVIRSQSYSVVNQFGDALKANPTLSIKIIGHTDSDGTSSANIDLSKRRAAAVKKYLLSNYGIADGRIQTDGKGATQPVADNGTADGKAKNRRVEFVKL